MHTRTPITIHRIENSRVGDVDFNNLEFGKYVADHMVVAAFDQGQWQSPVVKPYQDITLSPATLALHYGQAIFEGMKAYKDKDGNITVFRMQKHFERLQKSLNRMCMPEISYAMFADSLHALLETDAAWIPTSEGSSLYIRPLVFASEAKLGVKISDQYLFMIMSSPVGPYFTKPYRLKVEDTYVRTAEGGTGFAKCAGNYGGAFYPTQLARQQGFDQVLWTDHKEHKYIDEVGMMNVMFVIDGKLVTPKLTTAILDGVTRDSILQLAKEMGIETEERKISIDELQEGLRSGRVTEVFGAGTAAVVAPVALIHIKGHDCEVPLPTDTSFQTRVKRKLQNIRTGHEPDTHQWNYIIPLK